MEGLTAHSPVTAEKTDIVSFCLKIFCVTDLQSVRKN